MNRLPLDQGSLPGQVTCGNIKCYDRSTCYHGEAHDECLSCGECKDSPGCLPVEEVIKLAAIEAAEDEGFGR